MQAATTGAMIEIMAVILGAGVFAGQCFSRPLRLQGRDAGVSRRPGR